MTQTKCLVVTTDSHTNSNSNSIQVATYTGGSILGWREVEGGDLPEARYGLRAAVIDNVIHVTGGRVYIGPDENNPTSILSWDPPTESWQAVGNLAVGRFYHAAPAVASSIIASECLP